MIGRADIEGSNSDVATNAWPPQASYPCGNFSGTSGPKPRGAKGSIGHAFAVCIHTENQNQGGFCPFAPPGISVPREPPLGHLRCGLADVPPQPNSPPGGVSAPGRPPPAAGRGPFARNRARRRPAPLRRVSKETTGVAVFHRRRSSRLSYTSRVSSQRQTRVKLNRVFFPREVRQARSLGCGFAGRWIGTVGISLIHSCASLIR